MHHRGAHTNITTRQRYRPGARHGGHMRRVIGRCRPAPRARISSVPDCLFCKIVAGDVPADLVAESGRTIAFRDINPQAPTHVLVIPRDHYPDLAAMAAADGEVLAEVAAQAHRVAEAEGIASSGYRVVFNTGIEAGQTVFHAHDLASRLTAQLRRLRADSMTSAMRGRGPTPGGDKELTDTSREARRRSQGGTPADEPAAGSTQVKVVIPDDHSMVSLLGSGDELLHVIESSFHADIHVRGNEITITGTTAETAVVAELFAEMTALLGGGAELTPAIVERIIQMLRRKSGVRPAEVLSLDILSSRGRTIRPKTLNQKRYVDAIDAHTIVFCIGPAGTGKTYLAMAKAVKALQAKEVNRIILTRPAVEAGERLGFLPGTLYEKIDPYLRPLYDALHDM